MFWAILLPSLSCSCSFCTTGLSHSRKGPHAMKDCRLNKSNVGNQPKPKTASNLNKPNCTHMKHHDSVNWQSRSIRTPLRNVFKTGPKVADVPSWKSSLLESVVQDVKMFPCKMGQHYHFRKWFKSSTSKTIEK